MPRQVTRKNGRRLTASLDGVAWALVAVAISNRPERPSRRVMAVIQP